ncbi:MAG: SGNH/GDSL hydrolase family protein [Actinobacteria bacterium]|nr:SGNH/GDSL hydrolase family protein [Actinomycetota bacterium]
MKRTSIAWLLAVAMMLMASGCSNDGGDGLSSIPAAEREPRLLYVAVGASETFGIGAADPLREAWPQVFYRTALPRRASFVNLGIPGATVADALAKEALYTARLEPELVTVWLNVNDILSGIGVGAYERDLGKLLRLVTTDGDTTVLIANTPPLEWLPSYRACLPNPPAGAPDCEFEGALPRPQVIDRLIANYNLAIDRAAARVGASVVDLHSATLALARRGRGAELLSGDGFHPSTAGHREVARAFTEVFAGVQG